MECYKFIGVKLNRGQYCLISMCNKTDLLLKIWVKYKIRVPTVTNWRCYQKQTKISPSAARIPIKIADTITSGCLASSAKNYYALPFECFL